jgi:hypothetical protein
MVCGAVVVAGALLLTACGSSPSDKAAAAASTATTGAGTTLPTPDSDPVLTPNPTTTIVHWGDYHPSYNTVAQLYGGSAGLVFIAKVGPFEANDPTPGATFAPFDMATATYLASPYTPPDILIGIPQGRPGDVRLVVGATYLVFFAIDYSDDPRTTTCIAGGQRGLFDYDPTTRTVTRTDHNTASLIPRTLTVAQITAQVRAAQTAARAADADLGSPSDPEKWPPPPVCALSATGS